MKTKTIALSFSILLLSSASFAFDVECTGWNATTGAVVNGQCQDGQFNGFDSMGGIVNGENCAPGQPFTAFNSITGAIVNGECSSEVFSN